MNKDGRMVTAPTLAWDCTQVEEYLEALVEASLPPLIFRQALLHVSRCPSCQSLYESFQAFMSKEALQLGAEPVPPCLVKPRDDSPKWQAWLNRVSSWLDQAYPDTVQEAYRGAVTMPYRSPGEALRSDAESHSWEAKARFESSSPILDSCEGGVCLRLYLARSQLMGRVATATGDAIYPLLVSLVGGLEPEVVLNEPDGTFFLAHDAEATEVECRTVLGAVYRFPLCMGN